MSSMAIAWQDPDHEIAPLLARATQTQGWLRGQAAAVEQQRCLTRDVVERLVDDGLFRITQPSRYGGFGLDPRVAWQAVFEIAGAARPRHGYWGYRAPT